MKKNLLKRIFLSSLFTFAFFLSLYSQDFRISGMVTDASTGGPVPGATVAVQGTTSGTITDINGQYEILAPSDESTLIISFVGYKSAEIPVEGRHVIDIALNVDLTKLDEVVVIGYGTQKKEDLTGSVAVVNVDEMNKSNFSTLSNAFQGRAAGVNIMSTSGRPGSQANVKVRGVGSITLNSQPLYVVDGVSVGSEILTTLNPNDIESMQVLKDASATAIYGARGANGVILITTKKGQSGKPKFRFDANAGLSYVPKTYDLMNTEQYVSLMQAAYDAFIPRNPDRTNLYTTVYSDSARAANNNLDTDTDWQDAISRVGKTQNYNLSVSGGGDNSSYFISGNYANEQGILINTGMERYNLRGNSDFSIGDRLKIGESMVLTKLLVDDQAHYTQGRPWAVSLVDSPLMHIYDSTAAKGFGGPVDTLTGANERTNPVAEQTLNENTFNETRVLTSIYAELQLFKGLTYTLRFGANLRSRLTRQWTPQYKLGNMRLRDNDINKLYENNEYNQDLITSNILNYTNSFGNHNLGLMAAYERTNISWRWNSPTGRYITNESVPVLNQAEEAFTVSGGKGQHRLESVLGRLNYNFKDKYLLTASVRVDGSTRFGPAGGRYGTFPSFSAGWKINEDFLTNVQQINMLKLRFGWGQTGNENLDDYQYFALIDPLRNSRYTFGVNQDLWLGGASTSFQNNPMIKWEAAEMTNFGLDINAFANRLQVTAEYYIKNQKDMLVSKPISVTFGKYVAYGPTENVGAWVNLAKIQNRGFEFTASWRKMEGAFRYTISGNFSTYKNEVIDLGLSKELGKPEIVTNYTITEPGHTIGSFYGYVAERILQVEDFEQDENGNLIMDSNGNYQLMDAYQEAGTSPGDIKFKDLNNDGVINALDRTIIGKSLPDFSYGLNIDLTYKNFDVTLFLQGMQNMQVYNDQMANLSIATDRYGKDENKLVDVLDYWTPENRSNTMTRPYVVDENNNARLSTWFIENASFLRIKTLQVGYSLPSSLMQRVGIDRVRVFANANNLYTITKYSGYDPEIGDTDPLGTGTNNPLNTGVDLGFYPVPRSFMLGFQLDF
ncbi:MAG TPA: TonB-dependent receptor [Bacteroidales bacterium]|nr:TonB-dependent receptor [Bacteroidales bacterium]